MKKFLPVLVFFLALFLVGCSDVPVVEVNQEQPQPKTFEVPVLEENLVSEPDSVIEKPTVNQKIKEVINKSVETVQEAVADVTTASDSTGLPETFDQSMDF